MNLFTLSYIDFNAKLLAIQVPSWALKASYGLHVHAWHSPLTFLLFLFGLAAGQWHCIWFFCFWSRSSELSWTGAGIPSITRFSFCRPNKNPCLIIYHLQEYPLQFQTFASQTPFSCFKCFLFVSQPFLLSVECLLLCMISHCLYQLYCSFTAQIIAIKIHLPGRTKTNRNI